MTTQKKKLKPWLIALIVIGGVIAFVGLAVLGAIGYFRLSVQAYYNASEKAFVIPGLNEGFVPQGMHYDERTESFFLSGYSNQDEASPVYIVKGENAKKVLLLKEDGSDFTGHSGGVALFNDYVYIAGSNCLYVYSYSEMINVENGGGVKCKGLFSTKVSGDDYVGTSFVTAHNGTLTVGEFYDGGKYATHPSHEITTAAGDTNRALAVQYTLSESAQFGIEPTPMSAFSLPNKVQGLCFADGKIYLSTSYGVAFSHIYEYDESKVKKEKDITLLGQTLPLYALDSASLVNEYKIAPMSEEIVMLDGKLYVMCESASDKYIFGKFTGAKWCYKTDLSKMK